MGAENRLNYTVIGSNVNFASRLCGSAKEDEVLISKDTLLSPFVQESVLVEDLGDVPFKGFEEKRQVFKVIGIK